MADAAIYLWRGRSLFCGALEDLDWHRHQAAGICVALSADPLPALQSAPNGDWIEFRAVLVPPRCGHAFRFHGRPAAFLFFDPGSAFYEKIFGTLDAPRLWGDETADSTIERIASLWQNGAPDKLTPETVTGFLDRIPYPDDASSDTLENLYGDPRIRAVVRAILEWPDPDGAPRIEALADIAGVSPSRLAHLFQDRVGIPIRALRTWFRLKTAAIYLRRGANLTDAALAAGFYDQAHFTRTFRQMFGLPPSRVFARRPDELHWHIEAEALTLSINEDAAPPERLRPGSSAKPDSA